MSKLRVVVIALAVGAALPGLARLVGPVESDGASAAPSPLDRVVLPDLDDWEEDAGDDTGEGDGVCEVPHPADLPEATQTTASAASPALPAPEAPQPPRERLMGPGGCVGCGWEQSGPGQVVLAPPDRARRASWLARHLGDDGSWSTTSPADDPCWSRPGHFPGDAHATLGTTALVVFALVSSGQTHRSGLAKRQLCKALAWLKAQQSADGHFVAGETPADDWDQALATLALCELYAVSRDFTLKRRAQGAVDVCLGPALDRVVARQDPLLGGWWGLALRAARAAELEVPAEATARLRDAFPLGVCDDDAVALLAHLQAGGSRQDEAAQAAAERLAAQELRWEPGEVDLQRWFFASSALLLTGGHPWGTWHPALLKALLEHQRPQVYGGAQWVCGNGVALDEPQPPMDCREGSWDPIDAWGLRFGRAGTTALAGLCLEIYYRYERAKQD